MVPDFKTPLHGLNKKRKEKKTFQIFEKIKGGKSKIPKKTTFFRQQKFLADKVAGLPKNRPEQCFVSN